MFGNKSCLKNQVPKEDSTKKNVWYFKFLSKRYLLKQLKPLNLQLNSFWVRLIFSSFCRITLEKSIQDIQYCHTGRYFIESNSSGGLLQLHRRYLELADMSGNGKDKRGPVYSSAIVDYVQTATNVPTVNVHHSYFVTNLSNNKPVWMTFIVNFGIYEVVHYSSTCGYYFIVCTIQHQCLCQLSVHPWKLLSVLQTFLPLKEIMMLLVTLSWIVYDQSFRLRVFLVNRN